MSEGLFSDSWYRVARLAPRVRSRVEVHRHRYRGELWSIFESPSGRRFHRVPAAVLELVARMDGKCTVGEIWERASEELGTEAPTQESFVRLLRELNEAEIIHCDVLPDRAVQPTSPDGVRQRFKQLLLSPLSWRIPLLDPEPLFSRLAPFTKALFTTRAFLIWAAVVSAGILVLGIRWVDLSAGISDRVLTPANLLALWLLYPVLKLLHEVGHGVAVKAFGGEVREMGFIMLVFGPLPYVDASAATGFRHKQQRLVVCAAGMMVELFLASVALIAWTWIEPGLLRSTLFNVALMAGVSTLVFNLNPLLRFDGYYMLADALEIPNLGRRSNRYVLALIQRYVLGNASCEVEELSSRERAWFVGYAVLAFVYRAAVLLGILAFVATRFFALGVLLAIWATLVWVALPVGRVLRHVATSPELTLVRGRAVGTSVALLGVGLFLVCVLPAPLRTRAEGIVWVPEEAVVRAGASGFVGELLVSSGQRVLPGDPLLLCQDLLLETQLRTLRAKLTGLRARRDRKWGEDSVAVQLIDAEVARQEAEVVAVERQYEALTVRSPVAGVFYLESPKDLVGRFLHQGDAVAYVLDPQEVIVRVLVPQGDVGLVRRAVPMARIRLVSKPTVTLEAKVAREIPEASKRLPSAAFGTWGGGEIPVDPADQDGVTSLDRWFQFELRCRADGEVLHAGGRAFVRFDHDWEPLVKRWYRGALRLFSGAGHG